MIIVLRYFQFIRGGTICKRGSSQYIVYFGHFSVEKGIGTLIKVCKELPSVQFIFVGTGSLEDTMKGVSNIKNVGFQNEWCATENAHS